MSRIIYLFFSCFLSLLYYHSIITPIIVVVGISTIYCTVPIEPDICPSSYILFRYVLSTVSPLVTAISRMAQHPKVIACGHKHITVKTGNSFPAFLVQLPATSRRHDDASSNHCCFFWRTKRDFLLVSFFSLRNEFEFVFYIR